MTEQSTGDSLSQAAQGGRLPGTDDAEELQGTTSTDRADTADDDAAASGADVDGDDDGTTPAGALGYDLTTRDSDPQRADGSLREETSGD